jgi:hypothetical protein
MKHQTLILTLFFSTMFASPAYADWEKISSSTEGAVFYVDFDKIRKNGGYVYFWSLQDLLEPSPQGDLSFQSYFQGDCELFRYRSLNNISHKQPMGGGRGDSTKPTNPEWEYPPPNSIIDTTLTEVCSKAGDRKETIDEIKKSDKNIQPGELLETYHENGQLKFRATSKNGKLEGVVETYYEDGQMKSRGLYSNGLPNGLFTNYLNNGQLSNIAIYKNGKLDGPSQLNHENGQLHINTIFKDGVVDGFYEQYDNSGTLRSKCFHVNGKKQECEVDF